MTPGAFPGLPPTIGLSLALLAIVAVACTSGDGSSGTSDQVTASSQPSEGASAPTLTPTPTRTTEEQDRIDGYAIRLILPEVDLSKKTVPLTEIESGGVGADSGIPSSSHRSCSGMTGSARSRGRKLRIVAC